MEKITAIFTIKVEYMKHFFYLIILYFLYSCASVPKEYVINDDICHYNNAIFEITKDEMTFDVKKYKKDLEKGDLVLIDNDSLQSRYFSYSDGEVTNKQTNKQLGIGKWIRYDKKGKIKFIRILYLNGTKNIYKETFYNNQGNITKVIDYEKGYNICWAEAISIVKKIAKKDIEKYEIKDFYAVHNNLNEFPKGNPQWFIGFINGNEKFDDHKDKKGSIRYVIDGITGKLLRTYRVTIE